MEMDVLFVSEGHQLDKKIKVHGDNGMQCRKYIDAFEVGATYLMALNRESGDWAISSCGVYYQKVVAP